MFVIQITILWAERVCSCLPGRIDTAIRFSFL
jgi:hypothetical protein